MLVQELVHYFKTTPGFTRLLEKLVLRYKTLSRIGGSVKLTKLTIAEKEALTAFFRKDYMHQSSATISITQFEKALQKTKYEQISVLDVLEAYAGEEIITVKVEKDQKQLEREETFRELVSQYPSCEGWLNYVKRKERGTKILSMIINEDREHFVEVVSDVCEALCHLPSQFERLPFFAQRVTRDPHRFDLHTDRGRTLLLALQYRLSVGDSSYVIKGKLTAEEANDVLQSFHIYRDDLLNFVTVSGLIGIVNEHDHPVWKEASNQQIVMNMPLREIVKLSGCRPATGNQVFIVENSGVCSALLDRWSFPVPPPIICTNGQFKLAALLLIDLLAASGVMIYYSGDFDPEGLLMAQRLKKRAPEQVQLWRYNTEDYLKSLSDSLISAERMQSLNNLMLEELKELKTQMMNMKKAGFQENVINGLLKDIKTMM